MNGDRRTVFFKFVWQSVLALPLFSGTHFDTKSRDFFKKV